jgi:hypothetical protein
MPELTARKIAFSLSQDAMALMIENTNELTSMLNQTIISHEQHRNEFKQHIDFLREQTKEITLQMLKDKVVTWGQEGKKKVLIPKSTVMTYIVSYINKVDDMVKKYYLEVFKIDFDEQNKQQIKLF